MYPPPLPGSNPISAGDLGSRSPDGAHGSRGENQTEDAGLFGGNPGVSSAAGAPSLRFHPLAYPAETRSLTLLRPKYIPDLVLISETDHAASYDVGLGCRLAACATNPVTGMAAIAPSPPPPPPSESQLPSTSPPMLRMIGGLTPCPTASPLSCAASAHTDIPVGRRFRISGGSDTAWFQVNNLHGREPNAQGCTFEYELGILPLDLSHIPLRGQRQLVLNVGEVEGLNIVDSRGKKVQAFLAVSKRQTDSSNCTVYTSINAPIALE